MIETLTQWLAGFDWTRVFPELIGKAAGVLLGAAISWWVLLRKRQQSLERLRRGETDELLFQAHHLLPCDDGGSTLVLRNLVPRMTLDHAYENPASRQSLRELSKQTTLNAPVVPTSGRVGFEILNDAISILTGSLATTPWPRGVWLFCMTCEDRLLVRKHCVRCFLIKKDDLAKFCDWAWCRQHIRVERPWHWVRVVTLHRIANFHHDEQISLPASRDTSGPLIDDQIQHRRIVELSLGINQDEVAIADPIQPRWSDHEHDLENQGVQLLAAGQPYRPPGHRS